MSLVARSRFRRLKIAGGLLLTYLLCAHLLYGCRGPLLRMPLQTIPDTLVVDSGLTWAHQYAPFIYHAVDLTEGRQDLPTRVDFDGDLRGDNNWENLPDYTLPPVIYYAVLESHSHVFISYHIFHPRDWSWFFVGLHETHENDGENLQVVVDKATGQVVLLYTQAHYWGFVYPRPGAGFAPGEADFRGELLLVDELGRPDPQGRHAAVFVESGGHGIYGALDKCSEVHIDAQGVTQFTGAGMIFRPASPGVQPTEPAIVADQVVGYALESSRRKLWPLLRAGQLTGEGRLLDGAVPLDSTYLAVPVPRYYEGDRYSGPFGPDRGISPFALDFGFCAGTVGALYFDPAQRYRDMLQVPEPWSLEYLGAPFLAE